MENRNINQPSQSPSQMGDKSPMSPMEQAPQSNIPPQSQEDFFPDMEMPRANNMMYPDIYYKVQPFVMQACDEMDTYDRMPTQDMVEQMTDNICDNVLQMYPEMEQYMGPDNAMDAVPTQIYGRGRRFDDYSFRRRFRRRRSPLRDIVGILLLNELFRRRRRFF